MAPRGDGKLFICILFITCCCAMTLAQEGLPADCCLTVRNKPIPKGLLIDYRQQIQGQGCRMNATVLVTRRNFKLCVPADQPWVHNVMRHVDWLKKHCKEKNYKGKLCQRVTPE
ncbi:C-C motif chemokine 19-like [Antennarius striatus]|uniref:C-C motif chemokine 19-like n=1 Tax=Antennarius striatus TaxID=241820 RepID=UPI0035B28D7A